jgi:3-oxoacyl-[acyl-carrier protein] reductase
LDFAMKGKVALVTGAGAGIGRAIALGFGVAGARLVGAEIDFEKCAALREVCADQGIDALIVHADVRSGADVRTLASTVKEQYGRLDVLVNNVGHHLGMVKPLSQSFEAEWDALYEINLRHMFLVTREMLPLMQQSDAGASIINISSIEGFRGCPYNVVYTTFKHAVTGFTRALAVELAPHAIRVNLIAPETTETDSAPLKEAIKNELRAHADRTIPLGRFGEPEDHVGAALFLASPMAAWITGTSIHVDGGALAGSGFLRTPDGDWTNMPVVTDKADGDWPSVPTTEPDRRRAPN